LWICDAAGQNLQQLTGLAPAAITNPRWSAASDRIACNVVRDGRTAIAVLDARGGPPRFLETGLKRAVFCAWTADGKGLLVSADQNEAVRMFRLDPDFGSPAAGTPPSAVMAPEALTGAESPDGRFLYFTRPDRPGLWRLPTASRQTPPQSPQLVLADLQDRDRSNWRLLEGRIAWVMRAGGAAILAFYDLETGRNSMVADLPGLGGSGLAVSPDGMTILYARTGDVAADLMLLERFRPPE
jgi:Tol biopolymer transport system component